MYTKDDFKSDLQRHLANIQRPYHGGPYYGYDESELLIEACESARYELFQKAELLGWDGAQTEFEQHGDNSELTMIELIKKWIRRCEAAHEPPSQGVPVEIPGTSDGESPLSPAYEKAFRLYEVAEAALLEGGANRVTDAQAHRWLEQEWAGLDDYELPEFDTWQRYVRAGRKHYGRNKNNPRAGRTGHSIAQWHEI